MLSYTGFWSSGSERHVCKDTPCLVTDADALVNSETYHSVIVSYAM